MTPFSLLHSAEIRNIRSLGPYHHRYVVTLRPVAHGGHSWICSRTHTTSMTTARICINYYDQPLLNIMHTHTHTPPHPHTRTTVQMFFPPPKKMLSLMNAAAAAPVAATAAAAPGIARATVKRNECAACVCVLWSSCGRAYNFSELRTRAHSPRMST